MALTAETMDETRGQAAAPSREAHGKTRGAFRTASGVVQMLLRGYTTSAVTVTSTDEELRAASDDSCSANTYVIATRPC